MISFDLIFVYLIADDKIQYQPGEVKKSSAQNVVLSDELTIIWGRLNSYGTEMERVEFVMEDKGSSFTHRLFI
jgi:hypothetical protein